MAPAEPEQFAALQRFDQDPDLAELERLLAEFNLFRLLGIGGSEETHSRVLAWLLNPRENHRLGAAFLNRFLAATTDLDSSDAEGSAAQVQREWQNAVDGQQGFLDLLIRDEGQRFLCAIENKVYSGEHSGQLTRYRRALENRYPDFTRRYLFLSPWGTLAQDAAERKHWQSVDYNLVCQMVAETAQDFADSSSAEVLAFLRQYADVLRRDILGDTEVRDLARKIYAQHSTAIELIYQHKPNPQSETQEILKEIIENRDDWEFETEYQRQSHLTRFLPVEWKQFPVLETGTGWPPCKSLLLFEFYYSNYNLCFQLALSPGTDESVRQVIDSCVRKLPGIKPRETNPGSSWGIYYIDQDVLTSADFEQWDLESIRSKLQSKVPALAANEYPQIRDAVTRCLEEFEASGQP